MGVRTSIRTDTFSTSDVAFTWFGIRSMLSLSVLFSDASSFPLSSFSFDLDNTSSSNSVPVTVTTFPVLTNKTYQNI